MESVKLIKNDTDNSYLPDFKENDYFPTVSVVTPTFERYHLFDIAIFNWKNFIYPEDKIEWIILDDSSRESIKGLKKKLPKDDKRIKYYTCKKIDTIGKKRNKVNKLATGEIIVHMDDDDYYPPDSVICRVKSLLTYSKQCVGCSSINCINLLDNTCFKTGGGIDKNTVITGEASLAYYKSFWEDKGYDENVKSEECRCFLEDRTSDYIDLNSAFCMIAITHTKNMSDRTLKNSINRYNFFNSLPVVVVNLLEKLQLRIHERMEGINEGKDFIRSNYGKYYEEVLLKLEKLPLYIKGTSMMSSYVESIIPEETIGKSTVIATYFPGQFYRNINYSEHNNLHYKVPQILKYLTDYYSDKNIRLYIWTDKKFTVDNIELIPWYYFNKKLAADELIMFDEFSHFNTLSNTNHLVYVNISNEDMTYPETLLKSIDRYESFGSKNYDISSPSIYNLKYYFLGVGEELKNNKLFIETDFKNYEKYDETHSYSYNLFLRDKIILDNDLKCEFFILKELNIPLMCYLIKCGVKYFCEDNSLSDYGISNINEPVPENYFKNITEGLKSVIKII